MPFLKPHQAACAFPRSIGTTEACEWKHYVLRYQKARQRSLTLQSRTSERTGGVVEHRQRLVESLHAKGHFNGW